MTMAPYAVLEHTHKLCEIESIRSRFLAEGMADRDEFRPENEPNHPSSMEPGFNRVDDNWLNLRLGGSGHQCSSEITPIFSEELGIRAPRAPVATGPNFFASAIGLSVGGFEIIRPPKQRRVGLWFMLQASQDQVLEPILPQIPKSFLRIKDGTMTVRLLKKYLVHKLRLENESEVEMRCRGKQLQPVLTLQDVRDNIWWSGRDGESLLVSSLSSSSSDIAAGSKVMILQYTRAKSAPTDKNQ